MQTMSEEQGRVRALRDRFENTILAQVPGSFVNGAGSSRLPNTSSMSFEGIESDAALMLLDRQNVCCSAGSACLAGSLEPSHVLRAMGLNDERLRGSLRFSFSRFNTTAEADRALAVVPSVISKVRGMVPAT